MIERRAEAQWHGTLGGGAGVVQAPGIESPYSFESRFRDGPGTTPEALLGAAHAGCFSMALALILGEHGFEPERIRTTATVGFDPDSLSVTTIALHTTGTVPEIDAEEFLRIATIAKDNCPVSKALSAVEVTLASASLE